MSINKVVKDVKLNTDESMVEWGIGLLKDCILRIDKYQDIELMRRRGSTLTTEEELQVLVSNCLTVLCNTRKVLETGRGIKVLELPEMNSLYEDLSFKTSKFIEKCKELNIRLEHRCISDKCVRHDEQPYFRCLDFNKPNYIQAYFGSHLTSIPQNFYLDDNSYIYKINFHSTLFVNNQTMEHVTVRMNLNYNSVYNKLNIGSNHQTSRTLNVTVDPHSEYVFKPSRRDLVIDLGEDLMVLDSISYTLDNSNIKTENVGVELMTGESAPIPEPVGP